MWAHQKRTTPLASPLWEILPETSLKPKRMSVCALAVTEKNCLINPQHADFWKILVRGVEPLTYDPQIVYPTTPPETQIKINVALPAVPFRPRPACNDCRRDPAARAEFSLHFRPHWLAPAHYILKHTVDDVLLKNPQVAVAIQVLL